MPWSEAHRLTEILLNDPSSQIGAAVAGWQYPLSRGDLTLRDLYDLQHRSKAKRKPKPLPRPWDAPAKRIGSGTSLAISEYEAIKAAVQIGQPRDARGRFAKA